MLMTRSVTEAARSRIWKFVAALGCAAAIASVGISGCQDSPLPTAPTPEPVAPPSLSTYPTEEQFAEMPPEFRNGPLITDFKVDAWFGGNKAYGWAWMSYLASHAEVKVKATLIYGFREVTSSTGVVQRSNFLPLNRELELTTSVGVSKACGHGVNAHGEGYAYNEFFFRTSFLQWGNTRTSLSDSEQQPACSCAQTNVIEATYDPYAEEETCADGSTGGTAGSGTQFNPGDYTGGETVDFHTGTGNGGQSACGADAVVEFVCFDTWNEKTEKWDEWACGYVTTCG